MEAAREGNESLWRGELPGTPAMLEASEASRHAADRLWEWLESRGATDHRTLYMRGEHDAVGDAEFITIFDRAGGFDIVIDYEEAELRRRPGAAG